MNIIILFENEKQDDGSYHLSDNRAVHIRTILKSDLNDIIEIGILNGKRGTATIEAINDDKIILSNLQLEKPTPDNLTIDIIVALPRPQTIKKVLFTSAMMGVRNLFFIKSNRVEKSFFHSVVLEEEQLQRHLIDGLQQGKRTQMPVVSIHDKFKPFIQDSLSRFYSDREESPIMLLPDLDAEQTLADVINYGADEGVCRPHNTDLNRHPERSRRVDLAHLLIAIGPEGGFVPFETEMMTSLGFHKFKLGDWTLRVEHALTATLAQIELLK